MKTVSTTLFFLLFMISNISGQEKDTLEAHQLWKLGQTLSKKKALDHAQEKWIEAGILFERAGFQERAIQVYFFAGQSATKLQDWGKALIFLEEAYELQQKISPLNIDQQKQILRSLITVTQKTYSPNASNYVTQLSDLALLETDTTIAIQQLLKIATDLFNEQRLTSALLPLRKAEIILTPNHPLYFEIIFNIGYLYNMVGKRDSAILYHDRCFKFLNQQKPTPHFLLANLYNHLGQNSAFDNQTNPIELFETALYHAKAAKNLDFITMVYTNMLQPYAINYQNYGNEVDLKTISHYLDSIKLLYPNLKQPRFNYLVAANGIITDAYLFRQDTLLAKKTITATEQLVKSPQEHNITYYMQRGHLELLEGKTESAMQWIQTAIEKKYPPFVPNKTDQLPFPNPAFDNIKFETVWNLFPLKARVYHQLYQKSKNLEYLNQELNTILLVDSLFNYHFNTNLFTPSLEFDFSYAIPILQTLFEVTKDPKYFDQAMYFAEKNKAVYFVKHLNHSIQLKNSNVPSQSLEEISQIQRQIKHLEALLKIQENKTTQNELQKQRAQLIQLVTAVKQEHPNFFNFTFGMEDYLQSDPLQHWQDDEAIVEWVEGLTDFFGLVQTRDTKHFFQVPKTGRIKNLVYSNFIQTIQQKSKDFYPLSEELYRHFIQPIESIIKKKKLVIIPEGSLSHIPFELLMREQGTPSSFLIHQHEIRYSYSLAWESFNRSLSNTNQPNKILVLANGSEHPNQVAHVSEALRNHLTPIPGTLEESEHLSTLFPTTLLTNEKANEATFKASASNYNILHVATHAFMDEASGNRPCLIFSNTPDQQEDNFLYIHEILNLNLSADLVTLSACRTGVGDYHPGNGSNNLGMAFAYAGCKSLVSSLWSVPDESTTAIMKSFYELLKKGMPKAKALRTAKLNYFKEANNLLKHPYYWGAFTYYGNDQKIQKSNQIPYQWLVPGLLVVLGLFYFFFFSKARIK